VVSTVHLIELLRSNARTSSGWLLWTCFLGLDSYQFPAKNYGDLAFRIWGRPLRHIVNFLQGLQLLISVGVIVIGNGQALSQVTKFKLCYAVCCLIWAVLGFALGQVRTLQKYGILANAAVFINLLIMFISMGVFAHSPPNYAISVLGSAGGVADPTTITPDANGVYPPIIHYSGLPDPHNLSVGIFGLMQGKDFYISTYKGVRLTRFRCVRICWRSTFRRIHGRIKETSRFLEGHVGSTILHLCLLYDLWLLHVLLAGTIYLPGELLAIAQLAIKIQADNLSRYPIKVSLLTAGKLSETSSQSSQD